MSDVRPKECVTARNRPDRKVCPSYSFFPSLSLVFPRFCFYALCLTKSIDIVWFVLRVVPSYDAISPFFVFLTSRAV